MSRIPSLFHAALLLCVLAVPSALRAAEPVYGPELQGFAYPFPVETFAVSTQRQTLTMAYLDVKPEHANGRTAVLLHGKNFCAATWEPTIRVLADRGFRVIAPDQIGFCKSSKPQAFQFSFRELAADTHALLASLGIERANVIGHSTGGMLAVRYALTYPEATETLVLVDPLGLEDWSAKGVPPIALGQWFERDRATTAESIRRYEQATYYGGTWDPRYQGAVDMLAGLYAGPGKEAVAWDSALLDDMIMTQPVIYELPHLRVPTLLMIGGKDITAIGKDFASPAVRARWATIPRSAKRRRPPFPARNWSSFPPSATRRRCKIPTLSTRRCSRFCGATDRRMAAPVAHRHND